MYMQRHLLLPKGSDPTVDTDATSSIAGDSGASQSSSSTEALASAAIAPQSVSGSLGSSVEAPTAGAAPAAGSAAFGARNFAASSRTGLTKGWWQTLPQLHYIDFGKDGLVPHIPLVPGKKQTTLIAFEDAADAHFVAQTLLANALESIGGLCRTSFGAHALKLWHAPSIKVSACYWGQYAWHCGGITRLC